MSGLKRKSIQDGGESLPKTKKKKMKDLDYGSESVTPRTSSSSEPTNDKGLGKLSKFRIQKATRKVLRSRGVKHLFPIQYLTFDHVYDGKDLIGQARTGTGKTLSFVLPLLERLREEDSLSKEFGRVPAVLVLAPTRELANQVFEEVKALAPEGITSHCVYGGAPYKPQERAVRRGLDVLVGTPGRILDLMHRETLDLSQLKHVVLDEANQVLERGFAESVEEILAASFSKFKENPTAASSKPQLLLFSATIPSWVRDTADRYMGGDKEVVDLIGCTAVTVEHKAICCPYSERASTITNVLQYGHKGDGYARKSPHTLNEKFEGLHILEAVERTFRGDLDERLTWLYLNYSHVAKELVSKQFNLQQPLYFSYTHLVCRTALEGSQDNRSLSHPVHSDNCILDEAEGVCRKEAPAYTWRDYSAILYLNGDFEGGDFFFSRSLKDLSPDVRVQPRCGRLVGFSAGQENLHGVTAVTKGKRCAIALWFTLDPAHKEKTFDTAAMLLNAKSS